MVASRTASVVRGASTRTPAGDTLAILEVGALAVFVVAAGALNAQEVLSHWVVMLFLLLCAALSSGFIIPLSSGDPSLGFGVSAAILGFGFSAGTLGSAMSNVPVASVILVWALGSFIGSAAVRRDILSGARNAVRMVVCAVVYVLLWSLVDSDGQYIALGAALATVGYMLVGLALDLLPRMLRGQDLGDLVRSIMLYRLLLAYAINVLLVVVVHYAVPLLDALAPEGAMGSGILIAFTVTAAFFFAYAMISGTASERRRFDGVLGAALALPWPSDQNPLELMRMHAARAVRSDDVEIRDRAPRRIRELGTPFRTPSGERQWLVAVRNPTRSAFAPGDFDALSAVAHIGQESMRVRSEAEGLELEANTDPLTGLPNYRAFRIALGQANAGRRAGMGLAVVYIDMDGFKAVNDHYGHEVGNQVLRHFAMRLRGAVRPLDTVARVGGDEFVIILPDVTDREHAEQIAARIAQMVSAPLQLMDAVITPSISTGVAFSADPGEDASALVDEADERMYAARGRVIVDRPAAALDSPQGAQPDLVDIIAETIEQGMLTVAYQPIIDNVEGRIVALEALVRAVHPDYGAIPPDLLVHEARRIDRLDALTEQVLERAFADVTSFQELTPELAVVHVNIEVDQVAEERSLGIIGELDDAHPSVKLTLELTENSLNRSTALLMSELAGLRERGISLSLDDFGQAHSTMLALVEYPFDTLKVDRVLIQGVLTSAKARHVIRSLLLLARKLDVQMVVEGVETEAERDALALLGVRYMQGFLFARPTSVEQLRAQFAERGLAAENTKLPGEGDRLPPADTQPDARTDAQARSSPGLG